jgi:hypothetical protein
VIAYGLPATPAVASVPALLKLTLLIASPLSSPTLVNSVPPNVNAFPYSLLWLFAVIVNPAGVTTQRPST